MTFLAPGFLFASLGVAAAIVALHFIVTRQPRAGVLPTARFVPDLPATATARATRPSDLLLLLLRVLLVLSVGAALARPVLTSSRGADARVILVDISRSARTAAGIRDSALALYREGDAVIVFDSAAHVVSERVTDLLNSIAPSARRGSLSAALIAAVRQGSSLRETADSIELVIISPFAAEEMDEATDSIRSLWPGRARLIHVSIQPDTATRVVLPIRVRAAQGDPLHVTASLASRIAGGSGVIVRDASTAPDSSEASTAVRAVVEWPATARPPRASPRAARDTIGGVLAGDALVIAAFERRWKFDPDSIRGGRVAARWIDGEPAAVEWTPGRGCVRSVAVPVTVAGDLAIRDDFVRFVRSISGDCGGRKSDTPMTSAEVTSLSGKGGLASREAFQPRKDVGSPLAPWLFALALVAATGELFVRRRS
ncbi:MAG: BatA domain-containing protein [Gemmatimonadales bacterium]